MGEEITYGIYKDKTIQDILVSISPVANTIESSRFGFGGTVESIDHTLGNNDENWMVVIEVQKNLSIAEYMNKRNSSY